MTQYNELKAKRPFAHLILWLSLLFVALGLTWAYFAELDVVTEGEGKVVPSHKVQAIQNLEGGIVKKILVKEGQKVKKGQILLYLSDVQFSSDVRANQRRKLELEVKVARLQAEITNKPFKPTPEMQKSLPRVVLAEQQHLKSRKNELASLNKRVALLTREINMTKPVVKSGSVSEVELLRLQQSLNELKGRIHTFRSDAIKELKVTLAELAKIKEEGKKFKDRLTRTSIRSPVDGIVKQIFVNTEGGVIKSGMSVMEIVPLANTLLVEVRIKPGDIGFVHKGQRALVKITAFDYAIYGGLDGKVEHISADTSTDDDGNSFYEVWVRTKKAYLEKGGKKLSIIPGMQASVSIITGKKTVLDYLLKPFFKAKEKAFRER